MKNAKPTSAEPAYPVLRVKDLRTYFYTRRGVVRAVDGVDLDIVAGESVGLVGESGCGKSQTALSIMGLVDRPGRIVSGEIWFRGIELRGSPPDTVRAIRGREMAMIFQDPMSSLNPVLAIGDQVAEVLRVHREGTGSARIIIDELLGTHRFDRKFSSVQKRTVELLEMVGIPAARDRLNSYPHEFSGGMRQRVMIAASLGWKPLLLIADEPTTALDVTIQAQVLALINHLQRELKLSLLLITHDLGIVAENCHRVYVMYAGRIVEEATTEQLFRVPRHPYSIGLLAALPDLDVEREWLKSIEGTIPDLTQPIRGCGFCDRCDAVQDICRTTFPTVREVEPHHRVWCHHV